MIIKLLPKKDTYVTNLKTQFNDGSYANVGKASTIDLFKINSKSNKVAAKSYLQIKNTAGLVGKTFTLRESSDENTDPGTTFTFVDGNDDGNNIDISGENIEDIVDAVITKINSTDGFTISAHKLSTDKVLFVQDVLGTTGIKNCSVPNNASDNLLITDFKLFEHSAGLLNFPIGAFKSKNVDSILKSVFNNSSNFKAEIVLKDVGSAHTKPKDYSLILSPLSGSFEEGLGNDIIHFSDQDEANFITLDKANSIYWTKQDSVVYSDLHFAGNFTSGALSSVSEGDEDCVFDITDYLLTELNVENPHENFVVSFVEEDMFDDNDYFVKRFGSRDIRNKYNTPQLEIKIKDSKVYYLNNEDKKRYLDNEETFHLKNIINGGLTNFDSNYTGVRLKVIDEGNSNSQIGSSINGTVIYDYKGNEIAGIKSFVVDNNVLLRSNTVFATRLLAKSYVELKLVYYYYVEANDEETSTVNIREDKVKFYVPESVGEISTKNLRSTISLQQKSLSANDTIEFLKVHFIDIDKQYDAIKTPAQLISENIGPVYYEMFDVDTGEVLIKYEEDEKEFTELHFNGDEYILNLYCSSLYKNRRVNFAFYYIDVFSGSQKQILDSQHIVRFK